MVPYRRRPARSVPEAGTRAGRTLSLNWPPVGLAGLLLGVALGVEFSSRGSSSGCRPPRPCRNTAVVPRWQQRAWSSRPAVPVAEQDQVLAGARTLSRMSVASVARRSGASSGGAVPPSACRGRPRSIRSGWRKAAWQRRCRDRDPPRDVHRASSLAGFCRRGWPEMQPFRKVNLRSMTMSTVAKNLGIGRFYWHNLGRSRS